MMLILQLDTEFHSRLFGFDKNADENMGEFYFWVKNKKKIFSSTFCLLLASASFVLTPNNQYSNKGQPTFSFANNFRGNQIKEVVVDVSFFYVFVNPRKKIYLN